MAKPRIIKKWERYIVYGIAIIVDIAQIILDLFAVGAAVNRIIDIVMAFLVVAYGLARRLFTVGKGLTFLAYFVGEMVPFVDALPFWTLDIKNLYGGTVHNKEEREEFQAQKEDGNQNKPLNQDGKRLPSQKPPLLNSQVGRRLPNGGLKPPILKPPLLGK